MTATAKFDPIQMLETIGRLDRERAELIQALRGMLDWYAKLPEPGNAPNGLELSARLREARALLSRLGEG